MILKNLAGTACAATSGPGCAIATDHQLESQGYEAIVTKISRGDSSKCSIVSIGPGQTVVKKFKELHEVRVPSVTHQTMYVDLKC